MELVDILVLGTSALVRVGSNPTEGIQNQKIFIRYFFFENSTFDKVCSFFKI